MTFATIQAAYRAHRIATYPVTADKTPAVRGYSRIGASYSAELATRFSTATAAGFVAGPRNRLTVVDIDSTDDRLVDEILARFGPTPLQVRTPSGGRHLYYRHQGERRQIRPIPDVDILGGGHVVAAHSVVPKGRYDLERGTLDDLDRLPPLRQSAWRTKPAGGVAKGHRNNELFRHCHSIVKHCDSHDQLLDAASTWANDQLGDPLPDAEVAKTAASVWQYRDGRKRVMNHIISGPSFSALAADPAVLGVYSYLSAHNGRDAIFMIADGLGRAEGWSRRLVPATRRTMLALNLIECVRPHAKGRPALYRWSRPNED